MRSRLNIAIVFITTVCFFLSSSAAESSDPSRYLNAVRTFADNVLQFGRDTYGPKHTPLFVDGLNIYTHEPVKWISPKGGDPLIATETEEWILSNFADQQTLLRTLDGLSTLTGDPKYRNAAMQATKYFFENLVAPNGLFYWGQCTAYDAQGDRVHFIEPKDVHSLKLHYPYYELMWQTDRNITKKFIEAYWSTHILDWSNLDMNRSSLYSYSFEEPWNHDYKSGPAFFEGKGIAFIRTASSLVYSAVFLYTKLGQEQPLTWSKRLVKRYVDTRHPNTGISAVLYNQITYPLGDDLREHFRDPRTVLFPYDIAKNTEFYYPEKTHAQAWIAFLLVNEMLGIKDSEFAQWILEELTAWGKVAYRKEDNVFIPMLTDGTSLEGYVVKEDAFLGQKGDVIRPYVVDLTFLWAYSVAYRLLGDEFIWSMVRDIAQGNNFGDIGESPTSTPKLRSKTNCSDVYGLLSFLDLYAKTKKPEFLSIAQRIADNILDTQFSKGFFVLSKDHVYSRFDSLEPLALLRLVAALKHQQELVPRIWPSSPLSVGPYRYKEKGIDRQIIYTLRELFEPPLSLQEAAAIGDIKLIKSLVAQGEGVGRREDPFVKTALHRAVISNHQNIVEFLLSQGAPINAKDAYMATPLHYALERRNNEIVKLLIKNNADVAVRDGRGRTPVDIAISNNNDDIKKLLLAKAAETSIHAAVMLGDQEKVKAFLDQGINVNVEDDKGNTPLFYAVRNNHNELVQLLIDHGADINSMDKNGYAPLTWAIWNEDRDMIRVLVTNGADVNFVVKGDWPFLHYLAWNNDRELVEFFLTHGAKLNVKDKSGRTELHIAVSRGNRDLARFLVSKGATAPEFHLVACLGDLARVKSFVEEGDDVDTKDEVGWTPLYWAASMAEEEVAEFLIGKGAGIDVRTNNNRTPLHQAATAGATKLANLLISKGADVNARDEGNGTPLHSAAAGGHRDVVELLITNGAEIKAKDKSGDTPLHKAAKAGHLDVVQLLLDRGADINVKNKRERTPMDLAQEGKHTKVIELLKKQTLVHDVATTKVSAPTSFVQGDSVPIAVTLENRGDCSESSAVKLMDSTNDREIARQSTTIHSKHWAASDAYLTFMGEIGTTGQFGNWCWADGDVNGDGFNDLLITAANYPDNIVPPDGRFYLYYGGANMKASAAKTFDPENAGDWLGNNSGIFGDINEDGFDDIVIGARYFGSGDEGRVYIYYGGEDMDVTPDIYLDLPPGEGTNASLGRGGISVGDLNNDGHLDVVASAIRYPNGTLKGRVYLWYGPLTSDTTVDKIFSSEADSTAFGAILSARGDVNGDGCDDLLIAHRYYPNATGVGRAYLYWGAEGTSMDTAPDVIFDCPDSGANEFGSSADLFDIDNDGCAEVLIGARRYPDGNSAGRAYVYWGKASGFDNTVGLTITGEAVNSALGGDFINCGYANDDRYGDILITAYQYNREQSRAYLYYGGPKDSMDAVADHIFTPEPGRNGVFRSVLADLNGDGHGDVVMAGACYNNLQGRAWLWYGPFTTSVDITFNWDTTNASIGKHTLKVEIPPVPGEQNTEDNVQTVTVEVKEPPK